jgi:hypothetical protein
MWLQSSYVISSCAGGLRVKVFLHSRAFDSHYPAFNEVLRRHGIQHYSEVFAHPSLAPKAKDSLAKAVLAELPNQVVAYMAANGISPHHPTTTPSANVSSSQPAGN